MGPLSPIRYAVSNTTQALIAHAACMLVCGSHYAVSHGCRYQVTMTTSLPKNGVWGLSSVRSTANMILGANRNGKNKIGAKLTTCLRSDR